MKKDMKKTVPEILKREQDNNAIKTYNTIKTYNEQNCQKNIYKKNTFKICKKPLSSLILYIPFYGNI